MREKAGDYMGLLTPGDQKLTSPTEGYVNATNCQQIYGGHGYIEEWGMSQFVRDARITMIYEGANGIQALDLVGRKLGAIGGRAIFAFMNEIEDFIHTHEDDAEMKPFIDGLKTAKGQLQEGAMWLDAERHGRLRQCRRTPATISSTCSASPRLPHVGADGQGRARREAAMAAAIHITIRNCRPGNISSPAPSRRGGASGKLKTDAEPLMAMSAEAF